MDAFWKGNKDDAVRLLPQILQPAKVRGPDMKYLLHQAAPHGWLNVVIELATKYKCDVNCKDDCGRTPLHDAAMHDQLEVMKYLINEQHCDPMTRDNTHTTPLHFACSDGHLDITHYLISEAHCDPSCKDWLRYTPLHLACYKGLTRIVQYLLSTGRVDPLAMNNVGITPVDFASRHKNSYDLLKLFQSFPKSMSRLISVIKLWIANDEERSWMKLKEAMVEIGEPVRAHQLYKDAIDEV